jgi:hypothetical protein
MLMEISRFQLHLRVGFAKSGSFGNIPAESYGVNSGSRTARGLLMCIPCEHKKTVLPSGAVAADTRKLIQLN